MPERARECEESSVLVNIVNKISQKRSPTISRSLIPSSLIQSVIFFGSAKNIHSATPLPKLIYFMRANLVIIKSGDCKSTVGHFHFIGSQQSSDWMNFQLNVMNSFHHCKLHETFVVQSLLKIWTLTQNIITIFVVIVKMSIFLLNISIIVMAHECPHCKLPGPHIKHSNLYNIYYICYTSIDSTW